MPFMATQARIYTERLTDNLIIIQQTIFMRVKCIHEMATWAVTASAALRPHDDIEAQSWLRPYLLDNSYLTL